MNLIALADRLHKTIEEVEQISVTEFHEWLAYFHIMSEQADGQKWTNRDSDKGLRSRVCRFAQDADII